MVITTFGASPMRLKHELASKKNVKPSALAEAAIEHVGVSKQRTRLFLSKSAAGTGSMGPPVAPPRHCRVVA
jgi:hypothetical protein